MSKLTKFDFVEIFNESRPAGQAMYTARGGRLPLREMATVHSAITGLFCAERDLLLIEFDTRNSAEATIDELPKSRLETIRGVDVTKAVRELPHRADVWHQVVIGNLQECFPDLNAREEVSEEPAREQ